MDAELPIKVQNAIAPPNGSAAEVIPPLTSCLMLGLNFSEEYLRASSTRRTTHCADIW